MKQMLVVLGIVGMLILAVSSRDVWTQVAKDMAAKSPWGPNDEIGTLNMMTDASRFDILKRIAAGKVYDLSVDLYVGMPGCCALFGDPTYQIWMTHTPKRTTAKTSPQEGGELVSYSGDAVTMYTHTGTHIDTLNHFGLHGKIWNQVSADEALGARGWAKSGADKYPPIVARGVLIDVAKSKNLALLPESYAITAADLQEALKKQGSTLKPGDVVLIRTGFMTLWPDPVKYRLENQAGLSLEAAQWLVEKQQAMLLGADNFGVERSPSNNPDNFVPVHTYLFAERGVSIIEVMWLEELAKDQVYEFVFIATPLKGGASAVEPLTVPVNGQLQMNIDKGNQTNSGKDALALGNIANSNTNCSEPRYESKTSSSSSPLQATSDGSGSIWFLFGIDSGFESASNVYYQSVRVTASPTDS